MIDQFLNSLRFKFIVVAYCKKVYYSYYHYVFLWMQWNEDRTLDQTTIPFWIYSRKIRCTNCCIGQFINITLDLLVRDIYYGREPKVSAERYSTTRNRTLKYDSESTFLANVDTLYAYNVLESKYLSRAAKERRHLESSASI